MAFGAFLDTLIALRLCDFICVSAGTWKMERSNIVPRSGQVNDLSLSTSLAEVRRVLLAESSNVISLKLWFYQNANVKWNLRFATFVHVPHLSALILLVKYSNHYIDKFLLLCEIPFIVSDTMWDSSVKLSFCSYTLAFLLIKSIAKLKFTRKLLDV